MNWRSPILLLALACGALAQSPGDGFRRITPDESVEFPRDHGAHPDTKTEWWYLTGNFEDAEGRVVEMTYDALNRLVAEWDAADPAGTRREYLFYCPDHCPDGLCPEGALQQVGMTFPTPGGRGARWITHDDRGRLAAVTTVLDGYALSEAYTYDNLGASGDQSLTIKDARFYAHNFRVVDADGTEFPVELEQDGATDHVLLIENIDRPGSIGRVGMLLGELEVNISSMSVAPSSNGGEDALMLLGVSRALTDDEAKRLEALDGIHHVRQARLR